MSSNTPLPSALLPLIEKLPLNEQREALRQQMRLQRDVIALEFVKATAANNSYPRSMVMRFLTQQSGAKIIAEIATLTLGASFFSSITKALAVAKIIKSFSSKKSST